MQRYQNKLQCLASSLGGGGFLLRSLQTALSPKVNSWMGGLQVRVICEQIDDELRSCRLFDMGKHGFPMLVLDLKSSGECTGSRLAMGQQGSAA